MPTSSPESSKVVTTTSTVLFPYVFVHTPSIGKRPPPTINIEDLPGLECPPLSPATLNLLGTSLLASPTFNSPLALFPHPSMPLNASSYSFALAGPLNPSHPAQSFAHLGSCNNNPLAPIRSGCFSSPIPNPRPALYTPHSSSEACRRLLRDHPTGRRMDKPKKGR